MPGIPNAARTNLTSTSIQIHRHLHIDDGSFREVYEGTFVGGNRNQQKAACKCFKSKYSAFEKDFAVQDEKVTDKCIQYANDWNDFCMEGKEITINQGTVFDHAGRNYLVEPFIRDFKKYTSNSGTIMYRGGKGETAERRAMEAFSHYSYHRSGGSLIICDLQGHYKKRSGKKGARFELTDLAICSRKRLYGFTDLGEKGIESFFFNHTCNEYCHVTAGQGSGRSWSEPRDPESWFGENEGTSMLSSLYDSRLQLTSPAKFNSAFDGIMEADTDGDY